MSAAQNLPRLEPDCDVRKLPISPTEAFVLSRIDGASSVLDLSNSTGLPESTIAEALAHLAAVGAIRYTPPGSTTNLKSPTPPGNESAKSAGNEASKSTGVSAEAGKQGDSSSSPQRAPSSKAVGARTSGVERVVRYDRSLLEEEVDIPLDQRMDLLDLFFSIEVVNHYDLLGVAPEADRKAIKQAYFERVAVLHPDRFFGKNTGSYKARIERVFTALTKAHDTLTKKQARADYDSYLESRQETVGLRSSRLPKPPSDPPVVEERIIPGPARAPAVPEEFLASAAALGMQPGAVEVRDTESGPRTPATSTLTPGASDDARRHMARKLKAGATQPPPSGAPLAEAQTLEGSRQALEAHFRARYEARLKDPTAPTRFMALAAEAERAQSWASAVNALKTALELQPEDPKILAELARVELLADKAYSGKFIEQARYEERDGQFERAARSYERAARGRGSAELYIHAATCQLRADGGGRRAVELARRAVALGPTFVPARVTLARAYFQEGMLASAVAEVARALEVDPKNEEAKRLQAEFKKSG